MFIEKITIQNFKNIHEKQSFNLDRNFTTFTNEVCGTSVLDALRLASGCYFLGIPKSEVKVRHIRKSEIHFDDENQKQSPVKIEVVGKLSQNDSSITWGRTWAENKSLSYINKKEVESISNIAKTNYEEVTKRYNDKINLPLIAFFDVFAGINVKCVVNKPHSRRIGKIIFRDAYQNWDNIQPNKFAYPRWLSRYDVLLGQNKEYSYTKDAFFNAIKKAVPNIHEIDFYNGELWLSFKANKDSLQPINLQDIGEKYFIEMVAEIAYRCIILNGFKKEKAVEDTQGIAMINGLGLHLNHGWQKKIKENLKNAFPNIQFVVCAEEF